MTRDVFSRAAISAAVSSYRSSQELHRTAMPTPLRATETRTRNQPSGTTRDVVIGPQSHAVFRPKLSRADVQATLSERAFEVYEQLRKLESVTHSRLVEADFSPSLARYWLGEFVRRGLLRATTRGHVWMFEEAVE